MGWARMMTLAAGCMLMSGALAQPGRALDMRDAGIPIDRAAPWYQQCLQMQAPPAPATPAIPASCKVFDYYDKLSQAATSDAEWGGVRACAVAAKNNAVLSMLYANGFGTPRRLDLAIDYACRAGGADAEVEFRIKHLQALQSGEKTGRYDQCDDITSGYMGTVCAGIADTQAEKVRAASFSRLRGRLPANQQVALDQMVTANLAFSRAHEGESDMQGTAAPSLALEAGGREKEWLREHVAAFEQGRFDLSPPEELTEDDAELNRLYKLLMAAPGKDPGWPDRLPNLTVQKKDVRAAQRLWLAYRDAWVRFASLRYPAISSDAIKVELTTWRSQQLRRLAIMAELQARQ